MSRRDASEQTSEHRVTGATEEQQYEARARRWLRAYPPRWRRAREEEVLGVLLDTRPPGSTRLDLGARRDLVRGGLAYRWRSHPPLLAWLLYRTARHRLPARYAEWVRDDVDGWFYPLRMVWGGWLLLFVAWNVLLHVTGQLSLHRYLVVFVAGVSVVAMLVVRTESKKRIVDEELQPERRIAEVRTDARLRWSGRRRWSYGRWLAVPVVAGWLGLAVVGALTATAAPGVSATSVLPSVPRLVTVPTVVLPWVTIWALYCGVVLAVCRPRVADRPSQPWREEPSAPRPALVLALGTVSFVLPLAVVAGPLDALLESTSSPSGTLALALPVVQALAPLSFGMGFLGTPLLAVVLVAPLVHLRLRAALARLPEPRPALVDVLGLVGGREVLVDPPVVPARPVPWA